MPQTNNSPRASAALFPLLLAFACGGSSLSSSEVGAPEVEDLGERGLVILNPSDEKRDFFHDFGDLPYGETRKHTYRLQNTDSRPVTVQDLHASCSCSVGRISYVDENGVEVVGKRRGEPVIVLPPGVVAEMTFELDTTAVRVKNVDKLAQVRLRCDSLNTPFITFEMHLKVTLAFQATPWTIDLGRIPISTGARGRSDVITGLPGAVVRLTGVIEQSPGLEVDFIEEEKPTGTLWTVGAILSPPLKRGMWKGKIVLSCTGDDGTGEGIPFEIPVMANVVDDVIMRPTTLSFTRFSSVNGSRATAELTALAPGHRTLITGATLEGELPEGIEVTYEPKTPDATGHSSRWIVTVTIPPSAEPKYFVGKVILALDDSVQERVEAGMIFRP